MSTGTVGMSFESFEHLGGTPLDPRSPQAQAIADLFIDTLILSGIIFAIVVMLLGYAIMRFRDRSAGAEEGGTPVPTSGEPAQVEGNTKLEIAWTLAPLVVLVVIFVLTMRAVTASDPDPPPDRKPDLVVIAHQWWWEVRYTGSGVVTANEIHIPTGKPLVIGIESADVIHDFWVPDLARKIDAVPGRPATIWMQADAPGQYIGACAEYCGAQHAWMRILVHAESPEQFAAWEARSKEPAIAPSVATSGENFAAATRGANAFTTMTCVKCHALTTTINQGTALGKGEGAPHAGPDLTHLADRKTLGAGVMKNSPEELARWLKHPQEIKQGSHMPDLQLTDAQVADFVAYFGTLK